MKRTNKSTWGKAFNNTHTSFFALPELLQKRLAAVGLTAVVCVEHVVAWALSDASLSEALGLGQLQACACDPAGRLTMHLPKSLATKAAMAVGATTISLSLSRLDGKEVSGDDCITVGALLARTWGTTEAP